MRQPTTSPPTYPPPHPSYLPTPPPPPSYYFAANGTNVKAVLRDAGLVDVDAVLAQVDAGKDAVAAGIAGAYTFRWVRVGQGGSQVFEERRGVAFACVCASVCARTAGGRLYAGESDCELWLPNQCGCCRSLPNPHCRQRPLDVLARMNGTIDDATAAVNALLAAASREQVGGAGCLFTAAHSSSMRLPRARASEARAREDGDKAAIFPHPHLHASPNRATPFHPHPNPTHPNPPPY
jgi:hypothetical protein